MKNTHRADKKTPAFTVCGLLITDRRVAEGLIVTTMKAATCFLCGESKGVDYFKTPAAFIERVYPLENDMTGYVSDKGERKSGDLKTRLFVTKPGKCVVCTKDKKGWRRATQSEFMITRLQYAVELQEKDAADEARKERMRTIEAEAK